MEVGATSAMSKQMLAAEIQQLKNEIAEMAAQQEADTKLAATDQSDPSATDTDNSASSGPLGSSSGPAVSQNNIFAQYTQASAESHGHKK